MVKTLIEGIVLVFLVMYLFLQNLRATLIPTIAVPVVLLGTFAIMSIVGFSINTLSMFGLVLAIGLLVDDAIVVVENVERVMAEEGLSPRDATRKAMEQITGALIGVALVLSAVFVPVAFSGGSVGAIYRQFSLTIVAAMVLSVLVALILTPALCATILKPIPQGHHDEKTGFFGWFNRTFAKSQREVPRRRGARDQAFGPLAHHLSGGDRGGGDAVHPAAEVVPAGRRPGHDVRARAGAGRGPRRSARRKVLADVQNYLLNDEKSIVESVFTVNGFSFAGRGQNSGLVFVRMKDYAVRQSTNEKVPALVGRMFGHFAGYKDAMVFPVNPPSIPELGTASGFDFELQDRAGVGHAKLMEARNMLLGMAAKDPSLAQVRPNGLNDNPQFKVNIDREKANALGVTAVRHRPDVLDRVGVAVTSTTSSTSTTGSRRSTCRATRRSA